MLKKGHLKKETESNILAAQDQPDVQGKCTRNNVQSICHVCGAADEIVVHIVSKWSKFEQKEYKQLRHGNTA